MNLALMSPSAFGPLQLLANVCNSTVPAPCWRGLWFSTPRTATPTAGPRAVRRRCDFWYSSMSDGGAPPSGLALTQRQPTLNFCFRPRAEAGILHHRACAMLWST
jgi:hypothetical protein